MLGFFFSCFLLFLLLLEWSFRTFLCFNPSAQTAPEWPQITAVPTLVFNLMSCHSTKFKPVYEAASEDPSSAHPPCNLPALLLSLCLLFCDRKTKQSQKKKSSGRKGCRGCCQLEGASLTLRFSLWAIWTLQARFPVYKTQPCHLNWLL